MARGGKVETELKYQVAGRGRGRRLPRGARSWAPSRLERPVRSAAIEDRYVDTPDWALARAGYAARLRRTGRGTRIELKGASSDGGRLHRREELDGPADASRAPGGVAGVAGPIGRGGRCAARLRCWSWSRSGSCGASAACGPRTATRPTRARAVARRSGGARRRTQPRALARAGGGADRGRPAARCVTISAETRCDATDGAAAGLRRSQAGASAVRARARRRCRRCRPRPRRRWRDAPAGAAGPPGLRQPRAGARRPGRPEWRRPCRPVRATLASCPTTACPRRRARCWPIHFGRLRAKEKGTREGSTRRTCTTCASPPAGCEPRGASSTRPSSAGPRASCAGSCGCCRTGSAWSATWTS